MLTQAMPSVVKALSGVLPPVALKQLTQALGNCNQEVTQRGDVNVNPDSWTNINNDRGVYYGDTWNPNDYGDLINNTNTDVTNNNQNLFDFTTRQQLSTNNFYGGDTINNAGNTYFDTVTTQNLITNNIVVRNPGTVGADGPAGPPGDPGTAGLDGVDGVTEFVFGPPPQTQRKFLVEDIEPKKAFRTVVVDVTFDPETCGLTVDRVDLELVTDVKEKKYTLKYWGPDNGLG